MESAVYDGTQKERVWGIVSATEVAIVEDTDNKVKECYAARQDKVLATIVLSTDPLLLYLLDNPVSVWRKLEEQFQKVMGKSFKSEA